MGIYVFTGLEQPGSECTGVVCVVIRVRTTASAASAALAAGMEQCPEDTAGAIPYQAATAAAHPREATTVSVSIPRGMVRWS